MSSNRNIDYSDKEVFRTVKSVLISVLVGSFFCALFLAAFSLIFSVSKSTPYNFISTVIIIINALIAFISGFTAAKIHKKNGLFIGMLTAFFLFIPIFLSGIIFYGNAVGFTSVVKILVMVISGAIGGILGVNQKNKEAF